MNDWQSLDDILKKSQAKNTEPALPQNPDLNRSSGGGREEAPTCPICKGAQWLYASPDASNNRLVPCHCIRAHIEAREAQTLLSQCELPPKCEDMTFETFRVSPLTQVAYAAAQMLADETGDTNWLTFMGGPGRGKTHLAAAICRRWMERSKPARYAYVPLLMEELRRGLKGEEGEYDRRFDHFLNVPLLVLDDLGAEYRTPWVQEKLDLIVDYRLMHELALVVTTNCALSHLPPRIASRLQREGAVYVIDAPDYNARR